MSNEHPITPPPELLDKWLKIPEYVKPVQKMAVVTVTTNRLQMLATEAARWGADQELEACCEWLGSEGLDRVLARLRAYRRPKPPSLKEQALAQLDSLHADLKMHGLGTNTDSIRHALEQLHD